MLEPVVTAVFVGITDVVTCFSLKACGSGRMNSHALPPRNLNDEREGRGCADLCLIFSQLFGFAGTQLSEYS
jgi:hypothetical protein